jgi:L-cystine uptake protein TcyP (sodium:dicarboxylate symporter family)
MEGGSGLFIAIIIVVSLMFTVYLIAGYLILLAIEKIIDNIRRKYESNN